MRPLLPLLCLVLPFASCACDPPPEVSFPGHFAPASGVPASSYQLFTPGSELPGAIATDGAFDTTMATKHAGFLMAVPRDDATLTLAPESGLYLTPVPGGVRLSGPPYKVTNDQPAALDATTTILSFVLQHPMFAHPAPDVQRRQLEWLAGKLGAGWTPVSDAARLYDAALAGGLDPFADTAFVTALRQAITDAEAELPNYTPQLDAFAESSGGLGGASIVTLASGKIAVSGIEKAGGNAVRMSTETGTGLDYLYVVRPLPATLFPNGKDDPAFQSPDALKQVGWGRATTAGYAAASSYASYIDVIGNVMKWTTKVASIPVAPADEVALGAKGFYEVRFFSGALGVGTPANEYEFASTNFASDARAAFFHNVTAGTFEAIGLIPGAGEVFGSETGTQVAQEVVQQLVQDLEALLTAKGPALIEADDIYNIGYNAMKAAVDKASEKLTEDAQKTAWKQFFEWAKWGGKKAVKAVMDLPGKIAKGGSLAHRAARLTAPYSVMELHYAFVDEASLPEKISGSTHIRPEDPNRTFTFDCDLQWELSGTRPKLVTERPEMGVVSLFFTVAPSEPARLSLTCANLTVSPTVVESAPNPDSSERSVFTVTGVAFDKAYDNFYVKEGGTITGSSSGTTVSADFTMSPSKSEMDYSFATIYGGLVVSGTYERFDKATGTLIERIEDFKGTSAPPYLGYFSVEAK